MPDIKTFLPEPTEFADLEAEELAGFLLQFFNAVDPRPPSQDYHNYANRHNFILSLKRAFGEEHTQLLIEAYVWLEHEGFLIPSAEHPDQCLVLSRRGIRARDSEALNKMRRADVLPKRILHPIIAGKVWPLFLRGDYETAVFQAFKEVEIAVRDGGEYQPTDIGVDLMRKAFHPASGKLTDQAAPPGEKQARSDLFAGSVGCFRNPAAHRRFAVGDPGEAAEMIMIASYLMRVVDSRTSAAE